MIAILISITAISCSRNSGPDDFAPKDQLSFTTQISAKTVGRNINGQINNSEDGIDGINGEIIKGLNRIFISINICFKTTVFHILYQNASSYGYTLILQKMSVIC